MLVVVLVTLSHAHMSIDTYFTEFQFLTFKISIG